MKVCSGPQENTTDCSFLHVVGILTIFVVLNVGPESEIDVIVIIKILNNH